MAQKIQTLFIDDIDGGAAEGTVRFGLDGSDYEIDLSGTHSAELHAALTKYIEHARKVGGTAKRTTRGSRKAVSTVDTTAVRAWAKDKGMGIKDRGRVPASVVEKYLAATGS
jgi:Lsr2